MNPSEVTAAKGLSALKCNEPSAFSLTKDLV